MDTGDTAFPVQMADTRSRSVSKLAQHPLPRFKTSPRGVRLLADHPLPSIRASSADEKNGKFVSTKSAHNIPEDANFKLLFSSSAAWSENED